MARSAVRNRAEWAAVCLILGFFRVLPRRVADAAALAVVSLLRLSVRRYTRVARRNLAIAFPDLDEAQKQDYLDGCFRNIARVVVAVAKFPLISKKNVRAWIRYEGFEHFEEALRLALAALQRTLDITLVRVGRFFEAERVRADEELTRRQEELAFMATHDALTEIGTAS